MPRFGILYTTAGVRTWNVPTGVTSVFVALAGEGGNGGASGLGGGGGGGKGGSYVSSTVSVTPGNSHQLDISNVFPPGSGGFTSRFRNAANSADLVRASGGLPGGDASATTPGSGATGNADTNLGDTVNVGGNGSAGAATRGGAGGGGASSGGNGNNANAGVPGAAQPGDKWNGGAGGEDAGAINPATNGELHSGAGGGGFSTNGRAFGARGAGYLEWTTAQDAVTPADNFQRTVGFFRSFGDSSAPSDQLALSVGFFREFSDAVTPVDQIVLDLEKAQADAVSITEALFKNLGLNPADTAPTQDDIALTVQFFREFSDLVTPADLITKNIGLNIADDLGAQSAVTFRPMYIFDD